MAGSLMRRARSYCAGDSVMPTAEAAPRRLAQELQVPAPAAADVEDARARRDAGRLGDPGELVELSLLEVVGVDEKAA